MAHYTRTLLEPLHARLEQQAEELGRVKNELDHARTRIAELEAPPSETQSAPPCEGEAGRSWWRRLFG